MKKVYFLIVSALILGLVFAGCGDITKITAPDGVDVLTKASVEPTLVDPWQSGNAEFECGQVTCCDSDYAYKVDNSAENGTYEHEGNIITIENSNGKTFDWESDDPVSCVIVKAGAGAYVYCYEGGEYSDTGLVAPDGKDISHVTFCWNAGPVVEEYEELTVTKTAVTSYTRTHDWSIAKSVEPDEFYLYIDGSGDGEATWTVDVTYEGYEDSDWKVSGTITIENTGTLDANITDIVDVLGGTQIEITCVEELPYLLEIGETLTCTYSVDGYVEGWNEVTVTTDEGTYDAEDVALVWGEPTTEVNATVTVVDESDLFGTVTLGTATAPNDAQFTYNKNFAWEDYGQDDCGDYTYYNTAKVIGDNEVVLDYATAEVDVYVQCYIYETAYAKADDDDDTCFIAEGFSQWGWTNLIGSDYEYEVEWDLWAGAGQCDTWRGTLVGSVTVDYTDDCVYVDYNVELPFSLEETHVYAGCTMFPQMKVGKRWVDTVAPGQYYNNCSLDCVDGVYVIAHAVVGIPDPEFGP